MAARGGRKASFEGRKVEEVVETHRVTRVISTNRRSSSNHHHKKPAGRPVVEVMLSFDTTGSMYGYLKEVRSNLARALTELKDASSQEKVRLRVGVLAHGDYCDKGSTYVVKFLPLLDLTPANEAKITAFIKNVGATGGGDAPECYELALNKVRKGANWIPASRRALVLVGDALPHEVGYTYNGYENRIDWKAEAAHLSRMKVRVYAVQAGGSASSAPFYKELATTTGGAKLNMTKLDTVSGLVVAATMNEVGGGALTRYRSHLKSTGRMTVELETVITRITTVRRVSTTTSGGVTSKRAAIKDVKRHVIRDGKPTSAGAGAGAGADAGSQVCRYFNTKTGCLNPLCMYLHIHMEADARARKPTAASTAAAAAPRAQVCRYFNSKEGCTRAGCPFQHVKVCRYFNSKKGCTNRDCRYKHAKVCQYFNRTHATCTRPRCTYLHVRL